MYFYQRSIYKINQSIHYGNLFGRMDIGFRLNATEKDGHYVMVKQTYNAMNGERNYTMF